MQDSANVYCGGGSIKFIQKLQPSPLSVFCKKLKKFLYFTHFVLIAGYTTFLLLEYQEVRQGSFTLCALIIFGYMAVWTILMNFIFLLLDKQIWAVMFDRLVIKFVIMLWPMAGVISYTQQNFLNLQAVAYFALYMTIVSFILILYEIFTCTVGQNENPEYIFEPNDLKESEQTVWKQRKLYNDHMMKLFKGSTVKG